MELFSNPSRVRKARNVDSRELYRYYAGYSDAFVVDALAWCSVPPNGRVLDPWNGAGTTTRVVQQAKTQSFGFDLNPTMVIVGKANLVYTLDAPIFAPLAKKIVVAATRGRTTLAENPLSQIFSPDTAKLIRSFAIATTDHLVAPWSEQAKPQINQISPLPALFLVGIFNTVRGFLSTLSTSNPTWLRIPRDESEKISIDENIFGDAFILEMERLANLVNFRSSACKMPAKSEISVGDARVLPLKSNCIDAVITSPPYCTRLDYARTTMPELLILESVGLASYSCTRQKLMGASIVRKMGVARPPDTWGATCHKLLNDIYHHPSQSSSTYYYASHFNYFDDLAKSIGEISRVLKIGGKASVVVQDSHYKEIHNDLPQIFVEMAEQANLRNVGVFRYPKRHSIRSINSASKAYRDNRPQTEAALLFSKERI